LFGKWTELPNNQDLTNIVFFLFLPFLEEIGKFIATFFSSFKNPRFRDETTDPIIYAVVAGLGFAAAENLKVCLSILQENMVALNWQNLSSFSLSAPIINTLIITIFIRLLSAVFLHASSCSILVILGHRPNFKKEKVCCHWIACFWNYNGFSFAFLL